MLQTIHVSLSTSNIGFCTLVNFHKACIKVTALHERLQKPSFDHVSSCCSYLAASMILALRLDLLAQTFPQ